MSDESIYLVQVAPLPSTRGSMLTMPKGEERRKRWCPRGGAHSPGASPIEQRCELGRRLVAAPDGIEIGPAIRAAAAVLGLSYRTIHR
jgi:hypothetical protein